MQRLREEKSMLPSWGPRTMGRALVSPVRQSLAVNWGTFLEVGRVTVLW